MDSGPSGRHRAPGPPSDDDDAVGKHVGVLRDLVRTHEERIAQLEMVLELAPVGIGLVEMDGCTGVTNGTLRKLLGYTAEEFAALPFSAYTHPDDVAENAHLFDQMTAGTLDQFEVEKRFVRKNGASLWAHVAASLVRDTDRSPAYVIGMVQDISTRKRLEAELHAAEMHYRLLVERTPAVVYIAEPGAAGRWGYVSPYMQRMLGFSPQEWMDDPGLWTRQLYPADRSPLPATHVRDAFVGARDSFVSATYRMHHRRGQVVWVRDDATLVVDDAGKVVLHGALVDITQEKEVEAQLGQRVLHDPLTGLMTREYFRIAVRQALQTTRSVGGEIAVLFIDLDEFKEVNDTYGHACGDELLAAVAEQLTACSPEGTWVARLGGDEFALLVVGPVGQALVTAEEVMRAVSGTSVNHFGSVVKVGLSVGVAVAEHSDTPAVLLRRADVAMYRAKTDGRGRVAVYEDAADGARM